MDGISAGRYAREMLLIFRTLFLFASMTLFADPGPAPEPNTWQDKWVTDGDADSNILTIRNTDKNGFEFSLVATSGANVGEVEGKASWTSSFEEAKATVEGCKLAFALFKNQLSVNSEGCATAAGVSYDGEYRRDSVRPTFKTSYECRGELNAVEMEICSVRWLAAADVELASAFNALLGPDPSAPAEKALMKEQAAWVRSRNRQCGKAQDKARCIGRFYLDRIPELHAKKTGKKFDGAAVFDRYAKLPMDEAAVALKDDALIGLRIWLALPDDKAELFFAHNILASDAPEKNSPKKEIAGFFQIRGIPGTAGLVLTKSGALWLLLPTVEGGKHRACIFEPKSAGSRPSSVEGWLALKKGANWLPAKQEKVF